MESEKLKQFNESPYYDCNDIAEKLLELADLDDSDGKLGKELLDALYQIKAIAGNPYNSDYYRVLYNVLLKITGMEFG